MLENSFVEEEESETRDPHPYTKIHPEKYLIWKKEKFDKERKSKVITSTERDSNTQFPGEKTETKSGRNIRGNVRPPPENFRRKGI